MRAARSLPCGPPTRRRSHSLLRSMHSSALGAIPARDCARRRGAPRAAAAQPQRCLRACWLPSRAAAARRARLCCYSALRETAARREARKRRRPSVAASGDGWARWRRGSASDLSGAELADLVRRRALLPVLGGCGCGCGCLLLLSRGRREGEGLARWLLWWAAAACGPAAAAVAGETRGRRPPRGRPLLPRLLLPRLLLPRARRVRWRLRPRGGCGAGLRSLRPLPAAKAAAAA